MDNIPLPPKVQTAISIGLGVQFCRARPIARALIVARAKPDRILAYFAPELPARQAFDPAFFLGFVTVF